MKRSVLFVLAIVGLNNVVTAGVLINQNFDDTNVFVSGSALTLSGVGNSSTTAGLWRYGLSSPGGQVANDQSYSPGQSITTNRTSFGKGQVLGYVDNSLGATSGMIETSFRFRRSSTPNSGSSFRLGYSSDIAVFDNIDLGVDINGDNTIYVVDEAQPFQVLSNVDADQANPTWHAFKILLNIDTKSYDVYYSADATDAGFSLIYADARVDTIFSNGGSVNCMWFGPHFDGNTVYFDNAYLATPSAPVLLGDVNNDGHVNAADIQSIMQALADKSGYELAHGLTDSQLTALGDVNHDGVLTNADIQSLLTYLKTGNGSANAVPEPSTVFLLATSGLILFAAAGRRNLSLQLRKA